MSLASVINAILAVIVFGVIWYFSGKIVKGSQTREKNIMENGTSINVTILSMKQNGLFLNNNPVVEMKLKAADKEKKESWLVEKHNETALLIALDAYQVGNVYEAKLGKNKEDILFVRDASGRPVPAQP
ncbi:hypothetical protein N5923_08960 [Erwiniaceae bacterium BAC15a-03b]|uniref:Uncharacterized protein n=1 Tax=Winslowiella arboricola TaxID=2978220 RepID=A0A9J6PSA8_9GAMM|nr:hypothetical protein [Winslowiella arboricola]MCU5771709.1 hypothetical protein [Winslowiella arboricola]MCU5777620.1 hypothetical protein [Winslowiella arboricola]